MANQHPSGLCADFEHQNQTPHLTEAPQDGWCHRAHLISGDASAARMERAGGTEFLMGLCIATMCATEAPLFHFAGRIFD